MAAIDVRVATDEDIGAVVALWQRAAGPTRLPADRDAVRRLLARDPAALLLAVDGGDVLGSVIVGWDGWRCHLYRVAVDDRARRRGVGGILVDAAEQRARALGAARLDAMVADVNDLGIAFWRSTGFERDDEDHRWSRMVGP